MKTKIRALLILSLGALAPMCWQGIRTIPTDDGIGTSPSGKLCPACVQDSTQQPGQTGGGK